MQRKVQTLICRVETLLAELGCNQTSHLIQCHCSLLDYKCTHSSIWITAPSCHQRCLTRVRSLIPEDTSSQISELPHCSVKLVGCLILHSCFNTTLAPFPAPAHKQLITEGFLRICLGVYAPRCNLLDQEIRVCVCFMVTYCQ